MEMAALRADFASNPIPFILKPPLAARGEGIKLITSMEQIDEMADYIKAKIPLAQRYIPNPMLFHGHKMTFRLYVAITSWDPLRVFVFPNGLVRICSAKYSTETDSFKNNLVHLTNYDLQMDKEEEFNAEMPPDAYHDGLRSELQYIFSEIERTKGISSEKLWQDIQKLIACSIIPTGSFCFSFCFALPLAVLGVDWLFFLWLVRGSYSALGRTKSSVPKQLL
jgi:hypothetical protein